MNHPTVNLEREILRCERQRVYDRLYAMPMHESERQRILEALRPEVVVNIDQRVMETAEYFVDSNILMLEAVPREELVSRLARALAGVIDQFVTRKGSPVSVEPLKTLAQVERENEQTRRYLPPLGQLKHHDDCTGRHEAMVGGRCLDSDGRRL